MAILLAILPKSTTTGAAALASSLVERCEASIRPYLGPRYRRAPQVVRDLNVMGALLAVWEPEGVAGTVAMRSGRWAAATAPDTAVRVLDGVFTRGGSLGHTDGAFGSFAAIMGDRSTNRVVAWNTAPTLEAIHYGEDREFFYLSNRPMTIALSMAAHARRKIRASSDYLLEIINFGFSVSGQTPFEGVRTLPPRHALSVNAGAMALIAAPAPPTPQLQEVPDPRRRGTDELVAALRAATHRHLAAVPSDRVELRLSGGIDSRLLLGLLREAGVENVTAVCQGGKDSEEVMVAAQVAELAGVELVATSPAFIEPRSVLSSMRSSIVESQGFIPSEALVSPYAAGDPEALGHPLAAGQWPLFKGVLERTAENSLAAIEQQLAKLSAEVLTPRLNEETSQILRAWAASVPAATNYELLYMWGRDIRSSRYLQPHALQVDRNHRLAYPYVDSQVTAVADVLPVHSRMTQLTSFFALERVWPEALAVPLANGGRFRFESTRPLEGISGEHYEARIQKPRPYAGEFHHQDSIDRLADVEFIRQPLTSAARMLIRSPRWRTLRRMLSPEFRALVVAVSTVDEGNARGLAPADKSARWVRLMLWRLVLADLWLEGGWIPTIKG